MTAKQTIALAIMSGVVILLRAAPFLLFRGRRRMPSLFLYLGRTLSVAAMAMLVVYSLHSVLPGGDMGFALPALIAAASVAAMQLLVGNPLVSIVAGTALYMFLIRVM